MKKEHDQIIALISEYLSEHPNIRFSQALFNLDIIQFKNKENPGAENYALRDIHADDDTYILDRILNAY